MVQDLDLLPGLLRHVSADADTLERRANLTSLSISRQGSATVFQITCHKNLNGFHRIEGVPTHTSLHAPMSRKTE